MLRIVGISVVVVVAAFGVWLASHVKPSPDYAAENICTAEQIEATHDAIEAVGGWHTAAIIRTNYEFSQRRMERSLRDHISRTLTLNLAKHIERRKTATALCSHSFVRFNDGPLLQTVPAVAEALKSPLGEAPDRWQVATCFALRNSPSRLDLQTGDPKVFRNVCVRQVSKYQ